MKGWKKVDPHPCKGCGTETTNPGYCSVSCFKEKYEKPIVHPKPSKEELEKAIKEHGTVVGAAERYGVSARTFTVWLKSENIQYEPIKGRHPPENFVEISNRLGANEAAKSFDVSSSVMSRWIKEQFPADAINLSNVARELGYSRVTISLWFRLGLIPNAIKVGHRRVGVPRAVVDQMKKAIDENRLAKIRVRDETHSYILYIPNVGQSFIPRPDGKMTFALEAA